MSNKTLIFIILAIILVGAGAAGYFYWQQTKPLVVPVSNQSNEQMNQNNQSSLEETNNTASTSPLTESSGQCQRDFDQKKLDGNSAIKISGRQAEIDVKNFGKITVEFYDKDAPKAVTNFLRLTDAGFYDCLTFHRVAKNFVIQGGDPEGNGTGGISAFGKPFADELNPSSPSYKAGYAKGVLAMANSGPNTNTSQFFIMLGDVSLPNNYTIFGKVLLGQAVVDKIGQVDITPGMGPTDGAPKVPVVMQSVKIIK